MKKTFTKKEVTDKINEAVIKEELAIPLYVSHIEQTFFWSGLSEDKQKIIIEGLKILEKESEYHAKAFKKILKKHS